MEREVSARLRSIVVSSAAPAVDGLPLDPDFIVRVMMTVVPGLFKRRVTEPDFDGEAEVALALGIFRAAFDGRLRPWRAADPMRPA
jgi:hypothetical protein